MLRLPFGVESDQVDGPERSAANLRALHCAVEQRPLQGDVARQLVHPRGVVVGEPAGGVAPPNVGRHGVDLTRDDLLDNIALYWLTNTGVSAARLYWENKADFFDAKDISIPFAISVFPDELYQAPRSWAERAYPDNLIHYNKRSPPTCRRSRRP